MVYFFLISLIKVVSIKYLPSMSYVMIKGDRDFEYSVEGDKKFVIILADDISEVGNIIEGDRRRIEKVFVSPLIEEKKKTVITIKLLNKNWSVSKVKNGIHIYVGEFEEKDISYYIESLKRKPDGLDILFSISAKGEPFSSALAMRAIGDVAFEMGTSQRKNLTIYKSAVYYSSAASLMKRAGMKDEEIKLRIKSSYAYILAGTPEMTINQISILKNGFSLEEKIALDCLKGIALIMLSKFADAVEIIREIDNIVLGGEKGFIFKDKLTLNLYLSLKGLYYYHIGDFSKSSEYLSDVDEDFILKDTHLTLIYAKSLEKSGAYDLAKKYYLILSQIPKDKFIFEGRIGLARIYIEEGKIDSALRQIYYILDNLKGTIYDLKTRLFAISQREKLKVEKIPEKKSIKLDPIEFPEENLLLIIQRMPQTTEQKIAIKELISLYAENIEKNPREKVEKIIEILKGFRPYDFIYIDISEDLYKLLKSLSEKGEEILSALLFSSLKDFLPYPTLQDYTFIAPTLIKYNLWNEYFYIQSYVDEKKIMNIIMSEEEERKKKISERVKITSEDEIKLKGFIRKISE